MNASDSLGAPNAVAFHQKPHRSILLVGAENVSHSGFDNDKAKGVTGEMRHLWAVMAGSQGSGDAVCRVFKTDLEAQAYAATAREWHTRHCSYADSRWPEGFHRHLFGKDHRADLVDESKASSEEWPFGDDATDEFFTVVKVQFGPYNPSPLTAAQKQG